MIILCLLLLLLTGCIAIPAAKNDSPEQPGMHEPGDPSGGNSKPDPSFTLEYKTISKWLFAAGVVALFFRHNWGAGCAFAGAIAAPVVGKMTDTLLALSTYILFAGLALGFIAAWYIIRNKLSLPDDGNLFTWAKNKLRREYIKQ